MCDPPTNAKGGQKQIKTPPGVSSGSRKAPAFLCICPKKKKFSLGATRLARWYLRFGVSLLRREIPCVAPFLVSPWSSKILVFLQVSSGYRRQKKKIPPGGIWDLVAGQPTRRVSGSFTVVIWLAGARKQSSGISVRETGLKRIDQRPVNRKLPMEFANRSHFTLYGVR